MSSKADPLFPHFKRVRNQIRRFDPESLISHFVVGLRKAHRGGVDVIRYYQPWYLLLAIVWTLKEQDLLAHRRPKASLNDAHKILNLIYALGDADLSPDSSHGPGPILRRIAYQQFWLGRLDGAAISRQEILFGSLPENHGLYRIFEKNTGISIPRFLDLAFAMTALLLGKDEPGAFRLSNFKGMVQLTDETKERFFELLSRTPLQWAELLQGGDYITPPVADQLILRSPLFEAPLLKVDDRYISYFPPLIYRYLESCVYRILRDFNPEIFMRSFGPMFERYVAECIIDAGFSFRAERDVQQSVNSATPPKCVDFVIQETETDILIDAKGVEMSARGRVTWRPEVVYGATKTSVVKAIMQGMATAKLLQQERTNLGTQVKEKEKFLLIVTYEPFYLGNGSELWTALGSSLLSKLDGEFEQPWPLSPSCCYCITIREFEALLEYCNHHTIGIGSVLQRAKDADSEGKTRRFMLDQHLADQGDQGPYLSRLSAALDQLTKRCGAHLAVQDPPESIT